MIPDPGVEAQRGKPGTQYELSRRDYYFCFGHITPARFRLENREVRWNPSVAAAKSDDRVFPSNVRITGYAPSAVYAEGR